MVWVRGIALKYLPESTGIAVCCRACDRRIVWTHRELVLICGDDATLDPLQRLACNGCGEPPDDVWVTWPSVLKSRP